MHVPRRIIMNPSRCFTRPDSSSQMEEQTLELRDRECPLFSGSRSAIRFQGKLALGFVLLSILLFASPVQGANFFEKLGLKPGAKSGSLAELTQEQMVGGLREALARGVQHAVTNLGKSDGFLKDAAVKIAVPESLEKVERGLRAAGQGALVDDFVLTMNQAAEKAVPVAASVLADAIRALTLDEARAILTSTNTAATDYFKRTSQTQLQEKFLPIVKQATESAGVTAAYKKMTGKSGGSGALGNLGSLAGSFLNKDALDVDGYVTRKALDGLFLKIAEQEKLLRENPAARSTDLLKQVFGALKK